MNRYYQSDWDAIISGFDSKLGTSHTYILDCRHIKDSIEKIYKSMDQTIKRQKDQ